MCSGGFLEHSPRAKGQWVFHIFTAENQRSFLIQAPDLQCTEPFHMREPPNAGNPFQMLGVPHIAGFPACWGVVGVLTLLINV